MIFCPFPIPARDLFKTLCIIIFCQIIMWVKPFIFQFYPKYCSDIQLGRIRRKNAQKQSLVPPIRNYFPDCFVCVYSCIVQNYKGGAFYSKREFLQKLQNKLCFYVLFCNLSTNLINPKQLNL